ncbi:putative S-formylglutathione hydrolase [Geopyxis carbonaria]|nr:putative S-formylglutathione hydrolase [Geopyxis carbonaria]
MAIFETKATIASFGGKLLKLTHASTSTKTPMALNLYLPPAAATSAVPVLFYLSGLTCTGDNCAEKGHMQSSASANGIAIVYPDTSPRGASIAGEDDAYDFGSGAGFYIDATAAPWNENYNMYSYITSELPSALFSAFADKLDKTRVGIFGHSMGGHGALTIALKNPGKYKSVSAFAPICNPTQCKWGQKAFGGYFGEEAETKGKEHDATELVKKAGKGFKALVDVGTGDDFYKQGQLLPENFVAAAKEAGAEVEVRYQPVSYTHPKAVRQGGLAWGGR